MVAAILGRSAAARPSISVISRRSLAAPVTMAMPRLRRLPSRYHSLISARGAGATWYAFQGRAGALVPSGRVGMIERRWLRRWRAVSRVTGVPMACVLQMGWLAGLVGVGVPRAVGVWKSARGTIGLPVKVDVRRYAAARMVATVSAVTGRPVPARVAAICSSAWPVAMRAVTAWRTASGTAGTGAGVAGAGTG